MLIASRFDDEAWQTGRERWPELSGRQRVELLELRQPTHPADVQKPYRELIDAQALDSRDKRRYDKAVTMLRKLRDAYRATGDLDRFDTYVEQLRVEHKRRPTFLATLDRTRL